MSFMTDQEILNLIDSTWNAMWNTTGQDQWPCDMLMGFRSELLGGSRRYTTAKIKKEFQALLDLVVGAKERAAFEKITQVVLARRALRMKRA